MNRAAGKVMVVIPAKPTWMPDDEYQPEGDILATSSDGPSSDMWGAELSMTMLVDDHVPEAPGVWIWEGDYFWNDSDDAGLRGTWRRPTAHELWRLAQGLEVFAA